MLPLVAKPFAARSLAASSDLGLRLARLGHRLAGLLEAPLPHAASGAAQEAALRLELALRRGARKELRR